MPPKKKSVKKTQSKNKAIMKGMKSKRKDIIGFALNATWDDKLVRKFFSKHTAKELYRFFQKNGYTEIKEKPDCEDILKFRVGNIGGRIPSYDEDPCPGPKGY